MAIALRQSQLLDGGASISSPHTFTWPGATLAGSALIFAFCFDLNDDFPSTIIGNTGAAWTQLGLNGIGSTSLSFNYLSNAPAEASFTMTGFFGGTFLHFSAVWAEFTGVASGGPIVGSDLFSQGTLNPADGAVATEGLGVYKDNLVIGAMSDASYTNPSTVQDSPFTLVRDERGTAATSPSVTVSYYVPPANMDIDASYVVTTATADTYYADIAAFGIPFVPPVPTTNVLPAVGRGHLGV